MPSVSSLLENHHPSLSPIPGSPAHLVGNGNAVNNNNGNNNSLLITGVNSKSNTPNFENLVLLARNFQSCNVPSTTQHLTGQNNYGNQQQPQQHHPPHHQLRYTAIANRLASRPNGNSNCSSATTSVLGQKQHQQLQPQAPSLLQYGVLGSSGFLSGNNINLNHNNSSSNGSPSHPKSPYHQQYHVYQSPINCNVAFKNSGGSNLNNNFAGEIVSNNNGNSVTIRSNASIGSTAPVGTSSGTIPSTGMDPSNIISSSSLGKYVSLT